jgi:hypothetical protein
MCNGISESMVRAARLATLAAVLISASCIQRESLSNGEIRGTVSASTPVEGATVTAWALDANGNMLDLLARGIETDAQGKFAFDIGTTRGTVLIEAMGGTFRELWSDEPVALAMPLRAVILDLDLAEVRHVSVSPLTTIATELAERHLATNADARHVDKMRDSYKWMSEHFSVDITTEPVDVRFPTVADDRAVSGIMLAGLSALARRIAAESGITSVQAYNTLHLTAALRADVSDDGKLFDGVGPGGALIEGTCQTVCALSANTLRSDLARALVYDFLLMPENGTGLGVSDLLLAIRHLGENTEPWLFGLAPVEPIDSGQPTIAVIPTIMNDESQDIITFTADSEPIHAPGGAVVLLGEREDCGAAVYKHVTRMNDPKDNPLRWQFSVTSPGVGIAWGDYRVGLQGGEWLTDWLPAERLASGDDSADFQVVLLRAELPELATVRGQFEIEFRATDWLEQAATVRRCWDHVPLAAPADIRPAREVTGPESLHAWGLESGKQLAPLLNGVPLEQGAGIMEFEIRNGTDEPIYITLGYDQPVVTYTKDWIETSARVRDDDISPYACWEDGGCVKAFPPSLITYGQTGVQGTVPDFVGGLRIWEITATSRQEIYPCPGCSMDMYRLEPRMDPRLPRLYRVMLVTNELGELGPHGPTEEPLFYQDVVLHDLYALDNVITGVRYGDIAWCREPEPPPIAWCSLLEHYVRYRAVIRASVFTNFPIRVVAGTSATAALPVRAVAQAIEISTYSWQTDEQPALPAPYPAP